MIPSEKATTMKTLTLSINFRSLKRLLTPSLLHRILRKVARNNLNKQKITFMSQVTMRKAIKWNFIPAISAFKMKIFCGKMLF